MGTLLLLAGGAVVIRGSPSADTQQADARFSTPEKPLAFYISALRLGDKVGVAACFEPPATDFYLPAPLIVDRWVVKKRTAYGRKEVSRWNSKGIILPAVEGDVELQVEESTYGKTLMLSYNVRLAGGTWRIVAHSGGDQP